MDCRLPSPFDANRWGQMTRPPRALCILENALLPRFTPVRRVPCTKKLIGVDMTVFHVPYLVCT
jgi:hypothetical protein